MNGPTFPVYRKYKNNASWFKIISETQFEEVKKEPKGYALFSFEAKILLDRNFIHDMLFDFQQYWEECSETEYLTVREKAMG